MRMPEGWRKTVIGALAREVSERSRGTASVPVLSVTKYDGLVPSNEYFSKTVYSKNTENYKIVRRGQFAYATIHLDEGSIDYLSRCDVGKISPMYTVFAVDERHVDHRFLLALLKLLAQQGKFDALGNGGVNRRKSISFKTLSGFPIILPPLGEQCRIAEILSSVDEVIEATQAVIEQTGTFKQNVLKRLLTRGFGHSRFKKTGIGDVPEVWEILPLLNLLREPVRNGYSPVCPNEPTGRWILSLGALTPNGFSPERVKPAPLDDVRLESATLDDGDVLISRSNTPERVGLAGLYQGTPTPCYYPDLMMRLRFDRKKMMPEFATAWLSLLQFEGHFAEAASGTSASMVKINRSTLSRVLIPVPSMDEQENLIQRLRQVEFVEALEKEKLASMERLKSALMFDLLTGRKRVSADALSPAA